MLRQDLPLCDGWTFTPCWREDFAAGAPCPDETPVRLPHNACRGEMLPLHGADPADYAMVCGYRRTLTCPAGRVFVRFEGAAHQARVYANGRLVASHRCGYTAFSAELTGIAAPGQPILLAVQLDTREDPAVPPFGFVVDYLAYGGLYRPVWLEVRPAAYIADIYVTTPDLETALVAVTAAGAPADCTARAELLGPDGARLAAGTGPADGTGFAVAAPGALPWDTEHPNLYTCRVTLLGPDGAALDTADQTFGFRTAVFGADGFYLNGKKTFLRGLNRHQSYPYIGYAAPDRLQAEDARILRRELACNAVRTSHYPQSQAFLNACDRLGLLVFTELPGWQHIGDAAWQDLACENLREMILQNRSHPAIVLWGVRINESQDSDAFYTRTNAIAHELDPSRATSGVRFLEKSHLLEDVYAYNDFSHDGHTPGARPKPAVTPDPGKALLISEHSGHMYPTKAFDSWAHRQEQALRHARVLDAAMASGQHAGCFGWCMFDYQTHKDFGAGDRICYHGVMDVWRNPKPAAAFYASQGDETPVLAVCSGMDIGDYPAGRIGDVAVFSNGDAVRLYKNDVFVTELERPGLGALPHPPLAVTDTVGRLLESQEGYPPAKARALRRALLAVQRCNPNRMPLAVQLRVGLCMLRWHMNFADAMALYGKYIGNWGGAAIRWRFDAVRNGRVVASVTRQPSARLHLAVQTSHTDLAETVSYDMAAVRVRLLDENDAPAPYAQLPVTFAAAGPVRLATPACVTAEGGMCGAYLATTGQSGPARLTVSAPGCAPVEVSFTVKAALRQEV